MIKSLKTFKLFAFAFIFALVSLGLNSCKKSSNPTPTVQADVSLKFNDTLYNTTNISTFINANNLFALYATFSPASNMYIYIPGVKVGTFNTSTSDLSFTFTSKGYIQYGVSSGSVTVTSITGNVVTGTFQFTGTSSNGAGTVTNGTFTTYYTKD